FVHIHAAESDEHLRLVRHVEIETTNHTIGVLRKVPSGIKRRAEIYDIKYRSGSRNGSCSVNWGKAAQLSSSHYAGRRKTACSVGCEVALHVRWEHRQKCRVEGLLSFLR